MGRYDVLLQQDKNKEVRTQPAGQPPTVASAPPHETPSPPPPQSVPVAAASAGSHSTPLPKSSTGQAARRSFVRRSFDFYEDQVSYLTRVSLEERLAGKEGSMNAMVREAIDDYIKKRRAGK